MFESTNAWSCAKKDVLQNSAVTCRCFLLYHIFEVKEEARLGKLQYCCLYICQICLVFWHASRSGSLITKEACKMAMPCASAVAGVSLLTRNQHCAYIALIAKKKCSADV